MLLSNVRCNHLLSHEKVCHNGLRYFFLSFHEIFIIIITHSNYDIDEIHINSIVGFPFYIPKLVPGLLNGEIKDFGASMQPKLQKCTN